MLRAVVTELPSLTRLLSVLRVGPSVVGAPRAMNSFAALHIVQLSQLSCHANANLPAAARALLQPNFAPSSSLQERGLITMAVRSNQVDQAMRLIRRKVINEKLLLRWKDREYYRKPSEERVLQQKESLLRLKKKEFKKKMGYAMRRKMRGF